MAMPNKFLVTLHDMTRIQVIKDEFSGKVEVIYWLRIGGGSKSIMLARFEVSEPTAYILQESLTNPASFSAGLRYSIERSIIEKAAEQIAEFALDR
jgi:hypothetical protein